MLIERIIVDAPLSKATNVIRDYAFAIAAGLAAGAENRPLTLAELDLCADACCQDIANGGETSIEALTKTLPDAVAALGIPTAQSEFWRHFRPRALEVIPIVQPHQSIAQMEPKGHA